MKKSKICQEARIIVLKSILCTVHTAQLLKVSSKSDLSIVKGLIMGVEFGRIRLESNSQAELSKHWAYFPFCNIRNPSEHGSLGRRNKFPESELLKRFENILSLNQLPSRRKLATC